MEELHNAIEDAQYVNAVADVGGTLRPFLPWPIPSEEQRTEWEAKIRQRDGDVAFGAEWVLASPLGFFLFAQFLKSTKNDYLRINFMEYVVRYQTMRGKKRADMARKIAAYYLITSEEGDNPEKKEIEHDISRPMTTFCKERIEELVKSNSDPANSKCCIGLDGPDLKEVLEKACRKPLVKPTPDESTPSEGGRKKWPGRYSILYVEKNMFEKTEVVVFESLKKEYWEEFLQSTQYIRFINFLWFQERKVVEEDFLVMRVLGRGGFGLVTACKKGTSGKLFAMKVQNKKRIKIKRAGRLALNEHAALQEIQSPFIINMKYSFQSKDDIFILLDLMTGGDLSFHLSQKGVFSKEECLYYVATIALGLQAMHDKGYVYRDLKPENCLLDEDGRCKITDMGLATKMSPNLVGAAGTRGYWAPEMLCRDENGKRIPYDNMVDWFSFGCLLAEFTCGRNPFRTETALKFGMDRSAPTKEKAIDLATQEMIPEFNPEKFDVDTADLCKQLLVKQAKDRLGRNSIDEITSHPYFKDFDWDLIAANAMPPPFIPSKDVNAPAQNEIGNFAEDKTFKETVLSEADEKLFVKWDWTNPTAYANEVIEFLVCEQELGKPLLPPKTGDSCCCTVS